MALNVLVNKNWSDYEATSVTSFAVDTGALTAIALTIETGKGWNAGDDIALIPTAAKIPFMIIGVVTSYNSGTGALVANCTRVESTITAWDLNSSTSNTIGTGAKTWVTYNSKSSIIAATDAIMVSRIGVNAGNRCVGTVTSYNNADGTLVTNITGTVGSGTNQNDWIITSSGTYTAWDVIIPATSLITVNTNAVLTIDKEPKYPVGAFASLDRGNIVIANSSTTTPWVIELGARGTNSQKIFQMENNGALNVTGDKIVVTTGTGVAGQTIDLSGSPYTKIDYPGIEIETGSGTGVYRPWYVITDNANDRGFIGKNYYNRLFCGSLQGITSSTVTLTTASPTVITWNSHGLRPQQRVRFTTTGTYTGITTGTDYYIMNTGFTANSFRITTVGQSGTAINVSAQSGTHTCTTLPDFGSGLQGNMLLFNPVTRLLRCGNGTVGNVIPNGAKVRIPNIHFTMDYNRTVVMAAISSATAGNAVSFAVGKQANMPTVTTNTVFINQEEFNGTISGGIFTGASRALGDTVAANHAQGDTIYAAYTSTGVTAALSRGLLDTDAGGILNLTNCSFGNVIINSTNPQTLNITDVWCNGYTIGTTTSDVMIDGLFLNPFPTSEANSTIASILGATSVNRLYGYGTNVTLNNISTPVSLSNLQNLVKFTNIEGIAGPRNSTANNSAPVTLISCVVNCIMSSVVCIGGRLLLSAMSRFEIDGVQQSSESNGIDSANVTVVGVGFVGCQYAVMRNFTKTVGGAATRTSIFNSDANCYKVLVHTCAYDCNGNTSQISNGAGNSVKIVNGTFGTMRDAAITTGGAGALSSSTTGDGVVVQNCIFTAGDTYGQDNGNGATARSFCEQTTGHAIFWRLTNAFSGNFPEVGPYHVLLDNGVKNTGTLCATFSVKATRDIYTLNGTAYLDNAGSALLPVSGDYIILKSYQLLRTITGFTGVVDPEDVNSANLTYEFEMVGHEGTFTNVFTALTTANLNTAIAAISGYDNEKGLKIQMKITATSSSVTNRVINVRMFTTNNATAVLPIDYVNYTLTSLPVGSVLAAYDGSTELDYETGSGSIILKLPYLYDGIIKTDAIKIRKYGNVVDDHSAAFDQYDFTRAYLGSVDAQITEATAATVAAYTSLGTVEKIYDYSCYWRTLRANLLLDAPVSKSGLALDFFDHNVIIDKTAASMFAFDGTTITIKADYVATGSITTTGTITLSNGATTNSTVLHGSNGDSAVITLTVPVGSSVVLQDDSLARILYTASSSGTETWYPAFGSTGTWHYKVMQYGYLATSGSLTVTGGGVLSASIILSADATITEPTVATVIAYTTLETTSKLYDYAAYYETTTTGIDFGRLATKSSTVLDLAGKNLVIDTLAGSVWAYNGSTTITVKANNIASGAAMTSVSTLGTITLSNGAVAGLAPLSASNGVSGVLTIAVPVGSAFVVNNAVPARVSYVAASAGTEVNVIPFGSVGSWTYKVAQYGFISTSGSILISAGGFFSTTISLSVDSDITQAVEATVAAYVLLEITSKIYDYAAHYETLTNGIDYARFISKTGNSLDIDGKNLIIDATAASVWSYNGSTAVTIKANDIAQGALMTAVATTGTLTLSNGAVAGTAPISASNGVSGYITITLPAGDAIVVDDENPARVLYNASSSGTENLVVPFGSAGTWAWKVASYGKLSADGSILITPGGFFTAAALLDVDTAIAEPLVATVAAYVTLEDTAKIYDFIAYYETTTAGIDYPRLASKAASVLDLGAKNVVISSLAVDPFAYNGTTTITLKATTVSQGAVMNQVSTSGTITFGGASAAGTAPLSGSNGKSCYVTLLGLTAAATYIRTNTGTKHNYTASTTGTFNSIIPYGSVGTWTWSAKRVGYRHAIGNFTASDGGFVTTAPAIVEKLNADGSIMYQGTSSALVAVSFAGTTQANIDISNGVVGLQATFDETEDALMTEDGMTWLSSGKSDCSQFNSAGGDYLFLSTGWRLRRALAGDVNATLNAFAIGADGTIVDGVNGGVLFLTSDSPTAIAAAVIAAGVLTRNQFIALS